MFAYESLEVAATCMKRRLTVGILDHTSSVVGGAQFVNVCMAEVLSQHLGVEMIHGGTGYRLADLARSFQVDLSRTSERILPWLNDVQGFGIPGPRSPFEQIQSCRALTKLYDVFIYSGHNVPPFCFAKAGLAYIHFPMERKPGAVLTARPLSNGRNGFWSHAKEAAYEACWKFQMRGYTHLLANSDYTAGWIERRWGQVSQVLYPPVEAEFPRLAKRNLIVSIGRFTSERRSKHQLELVNAFRDFCKTVGSSWELCLVGFCGKSREDQSYLQQVQEASTHLPVTIVLDADRETTRRLVAESKLFWHAAGIGVDESSHPECAEHFGIATVEAMRGGCVPVVIASGGQREIIEHERSGFLADNLDQLVQASIRLATHEPLRERASEQAKARSAAFTREMFNRRVEDLVRSFV